MKKLILTIGLIITVIASYCQVQTIYTVANKTALENYYGTSTRLFVKDVFADFVICPTCVPNDSTIVAGVGGRVWSRLFPDTSNADKLILAGPITSLATIGDNPGTNITISSFILNTFYRSQAPSATLSGGQSLEFRSAQTMNYTLSWSAGRLLATEPLASIVVAGVTQPLTQPAAGSSVSGNQSVSFSANTDITYSNVVNTTDGKNRTATTSFSFLPARYYGWINVSDTAGIGTFGYDDSKITSLNKDLTFSKVKSWNTGNPTGTQIYVYAYYYTEGDLSNFSWNTFPTLAAISHVQRQFTNSLGYTSQWIIYWNKNGQIIPSDLIAN